MLIVVKSSYLFIYLFWWCELKLFIWERKKKFRFHVVGSSKWMWWWLAMISRNNFDFCNCSRFNWQSKALQLHAYDSTASLRLSNDLFCLHICVEARESKVNFTGIEMEYLVLRNNLLKFDFFSFLVPRSFDVAVDQHWISRW